MIEQDTIKLLRECDAGIKMGVKSIEDVWEHAESQDLKTHLDRCKNEHIALHKELETMLERYGDEGKNPNPIATGMSWIKTNVKLGLDGSDKVIADLITDGCNMGVKSLSRYVNQYKAADEASKDIANRLIRLELLLGEQVRGYL